MRDYQNKTVVITGASSGIGAEFARQLARGGARVALVARREDRLAQLAQEIAGAGGSASVHACDVAQRAEVEAACRDVAARWGTVDVLINDAGRSVVILRRFGAVCFLRALSPRLIGRARWRASSCAPYPSAAGRAHQRRRGLPGSSRAAIPRGRPFGNISRPRDDTRAFDAQIPDRSPDTSRIRSRERKTRAEASTYVSLWPRRRSSFSRTAAWCAASSACRVSHEKSTKARRNARAASSPSRCRNRPDRFPRRSPGTYGIVAEGPRTARRQRDEMDDPSGREMR